MGVQVTLDGIAAILVALTGLVGAVGTVLATVFAARANGRSKAIHREIQLSNGTTLGEATEATAVAAGAMPKHAEATGGPADQHAAS